MQVNSSYRDILGVALPVIVGSIATTVLNVTDSAFLGRIGEIELGASAIGGVLYFTFAMIGMSIGTGTQILIARRAGEKDHAAIGPVFDQSMVILGVLGIALFSVLSLVIPYALQYLIKDRQVVEAVKTFLAYRSFGLLFLMLATVFRSFYVGIAQAKVFAYYSFIMALLNVLFCYAMVFGHWGFHAMGIAGAGLASSLSEGIALVFLLAWTAGRRDIKEYRLLRFDSLSADLREKLITLSAPLVIQNLLSMGAWFFFFLFIEKLGTHELAISNAVRGTYMIAMTPIWGFSVAANSMSSNLIGQKRKEEVMKLIHKILLLALSLTTLMALLMLLLPETLLGIFTNDPQLIADSLGTLHIVIGSMFFFSWAIVLVSAVSGTGATRMAMYLETAAIV
ncbi:MAG: MATE family efflux transporter, partial [Bacteroidota bacterium]